GLYVAEVPIEARGWTIHGRRLRAARRSGRAHGRSRYTISRRGLPLCALRESPCTPEGRRAAGCHPRLCALHKHRPGSLTWFCPGPGIWTATATHEPVCSSRVFGIWRVTSRYSELATLQIGFAISRSRVQEGEFSRGGRDARHVRAAQGFTR